MAAGESGEPGRVAADQIQGLQFGNANHQTNIFMRHPPLPGRAAQTVARKVLFRVPRVVESFTARKAELTRLAGSWLQQSGERPPVQVITGLPGVGKTQLAAEYLARSANEYDLVAWIRGQDPAIDLAALADHLDLTDAEQPPEQRADRAVSALGAWDGSWLLVFDNVESPNVLGRWCPGVGPGRVLITARHRGLTGFGTELNLDVFGLEDATEYLLRGTGRPDSERPAAEALAIALGRLPLALTHAAAYCRPRAAGIGLNQYLEQLHELPAVHVFERNPEMAYEQTVASTWTASIRAATRDDHLARDVLQVAAMLGPEQIPLTIFESLLFADEGNAAQHSALGRKRLRDAFGSLHTFSLADVGESHLVVHRLLQKVIRDHLYESGDAAPLEQAIRALRGALPLDVSRPTVWPQCQELVGHVAALAESRNRVMADEDASRLVFVLQGIFAYLMNSGQPGEAAVIAERALALAMTAFGADNRQTFVSRNNLASAYRYSGRVREALLLQEEVLADSGRLLGRDDPLTLMALNNLAFFYESSGRVEDAITIQERVLTECEQLLGTNNSDTVSARANLAGFYWVVGRGDDALRLLEEAVADSVRLLGPQHPDTLQRQGHLAGFLTSAGRAEEALPLHERVVAELEGEVGAAHPLTRNARGFLAETYSAVGRFREALEMQRQVVADSERLIGLDNEETLAAQSNLARLYWASSNQREALEMQERLLAAYQRVLGRHDRETLKAMSILARYCHGVGRSDDAAKMQEDVLAELKRVLDTNDPATVSARNDLAGYYCAVGREAEAVHLQGEVVAERRRSLGSDHADTLTAAMNLINLYEASGRTAEAAVIRESMRADLVQQGYQSVRADVENGAVKESDDPVGSAASPLSGGDPETEPTEPVRPGGEIDPAS